MGVVDGYTISAVPGESAVVIGGQTVTLGGSLITLANHDVVSLGPNGLVVQMPGGAVTTMSVALLSCGKCCAQYRNRLHRHSFRCRYYGECGRGSCSAIASSISMFTSVLGFHLLTRVVVIGATSLPIPSGASSVDEVG